MKKQTKKLVLSKETVSRLEDRTLDHVAGGATQYCNTATACTCNNSCQIYCLDEPIGP
jgi:natural product precursor